MSAFTLVMSQGLGSYSMFSGGALPYDASVRNKENKENSKTTSWNIVLSLRASVTRPRLRWRHDESGRAADAPHRRLHRRCPGSLLALLRSPERSVAGCCRQVPECMIKKLMVSVRGCVGLRTLLFGEADAAAARNRRTSRRDHDDSMDMVGRGLLRKLVKYGMMQKCSFMY